MADVWLLPNHGGVLILADEAVQIVSGPWALAAVSITALATVISGILSLRASRSSKRTHEEIQTNHGLRAGEYLEQIAIVVNGQRLCLKRIDAMVDTFAEHAQDDERRFKSLSEQIDSLPQVLDANG